MSVIPKTKRYGPGKYKMHSGEEYVAIIRCPVIGDWMAQPKGGGPHDRLFFRTKQEASEWAYDWLAEHA